MERKRRINIRKHTIVAGILLFLSFLCLCFAASASSSGTCGDSLTWTLDDDGLLTISGTGEMTSSPWDCDYVKTVTIEDGVTSIVDDAFHLCSGLTSVSISNSVTKIGSWAFWGCSKLTTITIPESVTSIGEKAFTGCKSLNSINVHVDNNNYQSLDGVLYNSFLTTIVCYPSSKDGSSYIIPSGVTRIEKSAFSYCNNLSNILIPEGITDIPDGAFYYCGNLTNVTLPNSLTSIGNDSFFGCSSLSNISIPNGVISIGEYAFWDCNSLICFNIPTSVTVVENGVLGCCYKLTYISMPASVIRVKKDAFRQCNDLSDVFFYGDEADKDNITIEDNNDCLTNATWHYNYGAQYTVSFDANGGTGSMDNVLVDAGAIYTLPACEFTAPAGKEFDKWDLGAVGTEITVTANVTVKAQWKDKPIDPTPTPEPIPTPTPTPAPVIYTVTITNDGNGTAVANPASGVAGTEVTLAATPNEGYQFKAWEVVSGGVSIADNRFVLGTANVEIKAIFESTMPEPPVGGLGYTLNTESGTATVTGLGGIFGAKSIKIPATVTDNKGNVYNVTEIAANAFKGNANLTKISIGKNVKVIGKSAFSGCSKLTTVSGGANVTTIGDGAFQKCASLTKITIGKKVTKIGKNAFSNCKNLETITVKAAKLESIGKKAFKSISANAVFKCPKKLIDTYEPMIRNAGAPKTAIIK